ncbi:hypothetical protein, partial [Burkholderia sp. BE24]|uniref:hypothetical protein n=1 Tax=Burkholderia sp. BE24 TaxID=2656643 RepID=UPI00187B9443
VRNIDLEDLLGRDAVTIDTPHVEALLRGRVVMVTGAGGSIGSNLSECLCVRHKLMAKEPLYATQTQGRSDD